MVLEEWRICSSCRCTHQLTLAHATKKYPRDKHVEFHPFQRCASPCREGQLLNLVKGASRLSGSVGSVGHFTVSPNLRLGHYQK
jgi:hypothetical protein